MRFFLAFLVGCATTPADRFPEEFAACEAWTACSLLTDPSNAAAMQASFGADSLSCWADKTGVAAAACQTSCDALRATADESYPVFSACQSADSPDDLPVVRAGIWNQVVDLGTAACEDFARADETTDLIFRKEKRGRVTFNYENDGSKRSPADECDWNPKQNVLRCDMFPGGTQLVLTIVSDDHLTGVVEPGDDYMKACKNLTIDLTWKEIGPGPWWRL